MRELRAVVELYPRPPQILERLPIASSAWWRWVRMGHAPKGIKLFERVTIRKTCGSRAPWAAYLGSQAWSERGSPLDEIASANHNV